MAEKVNIPLPDITCEDFESSWICFELVAAAKEWSQEKQALILPTLLRGKLVECYVELEADTKKAVNYVKEELVKRLRLCREPLEAGKLFMTRSQLERERVMEFAMQLKKLFKQAYPEEDSTSSILLQRFVMGLKTPVSRQLLLRGKPDTFENAIEAAREIELVLEFESKPMELNAKISSVEDCDTGLLAALKDLTERLGNMEAQIQNAQLLQVIPRRGRRQEEQNKRRGVVMCGQLAMTIDEEAEEDVLFSMRRGGTYQTILSFKLQRACWNGERQQTRSPLNVRQYLDPLHFGCNVSNINSLLCIDGNVGKRSVNMLLDSGAAVSVIRSGVLEDRSRNLAALASPAESLKGDMNEEVRKMLSRGVIRPSSSPWSSPVVMVRKKNGSWRFCIDYRKLNAVTHQDAYPLPRIDATLESLAGSTLFTTLDLASGYWQVEIKEDDKEKTAFSTEKGHFEFNVMPFGLTNAPATFQRLMECILAGLTGEQWITQWLPLKSSSQRTLHTFLKAQEEDPALGKVIEALKNGTAVPSSTVPGLKKTFLQDGLLCRKFRASCSDSVCTQLVVPKGHVKIILENLHNESGHLGVQRTTEKVKERFYWPGYEMDIQNWVQECQQCQKRNPPQPHPLAPLGSIKCTYPFDVISWDIMGPLPLSTKGHKYILVITDLFSKWVEAFPLAVTDSETLASVLMDEVVCRYGVPRSLHSDQGANLNSQVICALCKRLGINKTRTTAYHPQGNGQVERFNRTLEAILSKVVAENQRDWDCHIPKALFAYRTAFHESSGYSPFRVNFGRSPILPIDIAVGQLNVQEYGEGGEPTVPQYVETLNKSLRKIFSDVKEQLASAHDRSKKRYDKGVIGEKFTVGDQLVGSTKTLVVHRNRLKRCYGLPKEGTGQNRRAKRKNEESRPQENLASEDYTVHVPDAESGCCVDADDEPDADNVQMARPQRNRRPPDRYGIYVEH
eukprot:Em0040g10a